MKTVSYKRIVKAQQPNEHEKKFVEYLLENEDRDTLELLVIALDMNKNIGNYSLNHIAEEIQLEIHNITPKQWERAVRKAYNIIKGES